MGHVGIDYSMTCPAACLYSAADTKFWYAHDLKRIFVPNVTADAVIEGSVSVRARHLSTRLVEWLFLHAPGIKSIHIEDYAFAATGRVFHIGENTGILKYTLDHWNIAYHPVAPNVIKKFATGKGNADKYKMTMAFLDAYPAGRAWIKELFPRTKDDTPAKSPLADIADAYWIARYAAEH